MGSLPSHADDRRDWWLVAVMAGLLIAMLTGLARPVNHDTPPVDEQIPTLVD